MSDKMVDCRICTEPQYCDCLCSVCMKAKSKFEYAKHVNHLLEKMAEYEIPDYMQHSLVEYIMTGRPVGGFLSAVLENDLIAAVNRADEKNAKALVNYIKFLWNHAPNGCFGYTGVTEYWRERGGLAWVMELTR